MKKPLEKTPYLFVYGTLMRGYGNHVLLQDSEFIDTASTENEYKLVASGIPFLLELDSSYPVLGEIYKIDDETLPSIDALEGHPYMYERKIISVVSSSGEVYEAWTYFYTNPNSGGQEIKSGSYRDYSYTFRYQD
jgi:gamma-glutamylcyclotransferase (GGCT)/AIG2-like uncharacterized protein YtfP